MKRFSSLIITISVLFSFSPQTLSQENTEAKLLEQFHKITSEEMMTWVEKLCSPEFNGRLTGTPGYTASAEWIAGKAEGMGSKTSRKQWNLFSVV